MTISIIALIILIIMLLARYLWNYATRYRCSVDGHKWCATEDGYICERCKISYESDGWL